MRSEPMKRESVSLELDKSIQKALDMLGKSLLENEIIQNYRQAEKRVNNHAGLAKLIDQIKVEQKNAVNFAHYGKPEAEKIAIKKADSLTTEFNEHPLVIHYRECLFEANELVQYITNSIETKVNNRLEEELSKNRTDGKNKER